MVAGLHRASPSATLNKRTTIKMIIMIIPLSKKYVKYVHFIFSELFLENNSRLFFVVFCPFSLLFKLCVKIMTKNQDLIGL